MNNRIGAFRSILKFAYENELIDAPIGFGESFKRPERGFLRRAKAQAGRTHFHADEIRRMLDVSRTYLRAMILLGINRGLGNTEPAKLSAACINLEPGRIDYPRVKTGIDRRSPLWPEAIQAIREGNAVINRSKVSRHPSADGLLFVTRMGLPCMRTGYKPDRKGMPCSRHDQVHDATLLNPMTRSCYMGRPANQAKAHDRRERLRWLEMAELTLARFCSREGVTMSMFWYWRRKCAVLGGPFTRSAAAFAPADIIGVRSVKLRFASGAMLEIPEDCPALVRLAIEAIVGTMQPR